jgi:prepilin-type N-terminal cleavage/methylation domain-containing protein
MILALLKDARRRSQRGQHGFTLVELLVVIAILGVLAAIVLFNISGVNANAACNGMKTDGATIQGAADLYWNTYGVYPVGTDSGRRYDGQPAGADHGQPASQHDRELELRRASERNRAFHLQGGPTARYRARRDPGQRDLRLQLSDPFSS